MEINCAETLQTPTGKNYQLTWIDHYSNFRFRDGQRYVARNYVFKLILEGGGLVWFTVAIDDLVIVAFESQYQRKMTPEEQADMAKQRIQEALARRQNLGKNNLVEVKAERVMQAAQGSEH